MASLEESRTNAETNPRGKSPLRHGNVEKMLMSTKRLVLGGRKASHKLDEKETDKKRKYLRKQEKRGTEKKFIVELIQKKKDAGDDDTTEEAKKAKELAAQLARSGLG